MDQLAWVKEKYETSWGYYLRQAEQAAADEKQNLPRLFSRCLRVRGENAQKIWRGYLPTIGGMPLSPRVPSICQMNYYSGVVGELIQQEIEPDVERIVEMGSGWGAVITGLWLSGAPREADYYALEYTENGRSLSDILSNSEPRFKLTSHAFDYYDASFKCLGTQSKKTILYSVFSIEQITEVPDSLIERMLAVPGFVKAVHIEPVGWQLRANSLGATIDRILKRFGIPPLTRNAAAARRCWKQKFNRNLVDVLRRFEAAGRIVIEKIDADIVSHHPGNPGTLVVWRKA